MANEQWMKVPYFGRGMAESLERALTTGRYKDGLDKALFYFATDTKQWILVDPDKTIHAVTSADSGGDKGGVKRVERLPSVVEARTDYLYVMGNVVYSFDGTMFHPTYEEAIGSLPEQTTVVEYVNATKDEAIESAHMYTDEKLRLNIVQGGAE